MIDWISVDEAVPNTHDLVLIWVPSNAPRYCMTFYSGGGWASYNADDVTHWATLTPPKGVDNG